MPLALISFVFIEYSVDSLYSSFCSKLLCDEKFLNLKSSRFPQNDLGNTHTQALIFEQEELSYDTSFKGKFHFLLRMLLLSVT